MCGSLSAPWPKLIPQHSYRVFVSLVFVYSSHFLGTRSSANEHPDLQEVSHVYFPVLPVLGFFSLFLCNSDLEMILYYLDLLLIDLCSYWICVISELT